MQLSAAIREGARLIPGLCTTEYFEPGRSDAAGAALAGVLGRVPARLKGERREAFDRHVRESLGVHFPQLSTFREHPVNVNKTKTVGMLLVDLVDFHGWTREQVADWLTKEGL